MLNSVMRYERCDMRRDGACFTCHQNAGFEVLIGLDYGDEIW